MLGMATDVLTLGIAGMPSEAQLIPVAISSVVMAFIGDVRS